MNLTHEELIVLHDHLYTLVTARFPHLDAQRLHSHEVGLFLTGLTRVFVRPTRWGAVEVTAHSVGYSGGPRVTEYSLADPQVETKVVRRLRELVRRVPESELRRADT